MTWKFYKRLLFLMLISISIIAGYEVNRQFYVFAFLNSPFRDENVMSMGAEFLEGYEGSYEFLENIEDDGIIKEHGDIFVKWDREIVSEIQKAVDNGHQPWRLDPILTAMAFISEKEIYDVMLEDLIVVRRLDDRAIVKVNKKGIKTIYLEKLADKSEYGAWFVTSYDE